MKNITKIINIFGGVKGLCASVENWPYMRLVIEDIGRGPRGYQAISVAHYSKQNGDLCQDPEMGFEIVSQGESTTYEPFFYQDRILYREVFPNGTASENQRLKRQLTSFAQLWDRNIGEQGFVIAAAQQKAAPKERKA